MTSKVLIVEDDPGLRETLATGLEEDGFEVTCAASGEAGLASLRERPVEVVLTDLRMKGMSGLELCRRVAEVSPELPVVLMTAFGDLEAAVGAIRAGAYDFLAKPFEPEELAIVLERAARTYRLTAEVSALRARLREVEPFEELLGECRDMRALCDLIDRSAPTDATVLIGGETGSGKELVARALHRRSARARGPFVAINCAAVPESLLESELFGHARGAFTGAESARAGLLRRAQGGTLFLDEVGDMPLALQAKLLRVLQERRVRAVGSDEEHEVDCRIVAATHRDLEAAVGEGSFRQDLLYRLNVIELRVPPLRDRGNDVLLLAQRFVEEHAGRMGREVRGISAQAAAKLLAYDWPGNVRELENCMERAVALTTHRELVVEDLAPRVRDHAPATPREGEVDLIPLDQVERRHVLAVLDAVDGNKARAASVLRIGRKTLYRKLEQYQRASADSCPQPSPPRSR
ncbi:MAG: sigma-54-dependent Fis family transcriptional regulator [Planctomycetes bacterium]|nr:sigma-54-dependent Fis family transcriptional regulator [Planctomycetota bacterium]